jgi:hypothetical protein
LTLNALERKMTEYDNKMAVQLPEEISLQQILKTMKVRYFFLPRLISPLGL